MTRHKASLAVAIILLSLTQAFIAQVTPAKIDVEKRVDSILSKMTLAEKIEIIGGINDFYTRPIPRLGIPSLRMSDGPLGVHDYGLTTEGVRQSKSETGRDQACNTPARSQRLVFL